MTDGNFSLDDILNEYPKKDKPTGSTHRSSADLDAELAALLGTDIAGTPQPVPEKKAEPKPADEAVPKPKTAERPASADTYTKPAPAEESILKDKYKKDPFSYLRKSGAAPELNSSGTATAVAERPNAAETADIPESKADEKPAEPPVSDEEAKRKKEVIDRFYESLVSEKKSQPPKHESSEIAEAREKLHQAAEERRRTAERRPVSTATGLVSVHDVPEQKPSEELMRAYAGETKREQTAQHDKSYNQYAELYRRPAKKPPLEKYSDVLKKDELSDIYMDKTGKIPAAAEHKKGNTIVKGFTAFFSKLRPENKENTAEPNPAEVPADDAPPKHEEEKPAKDKFAEYYKERTQHTGLHDFMNGFTGMLAKPQGEEPDENLGLVDEMRRIRAERKTPPSPIERQRPTDIDLKQLNGKIIPNTSKISRPKSETEEPEDVLDRTEESEKIIELKERRNKVVDNFHIRLVGDEEESPDEELPENSGEKDSIDDFNNFDDAESIADDISQLKSTLLVRFAVLLICFLLTAYMGLANDFSLPIIQLLDKSTQAPAFIFVNAIVGVLAVFSSYTVISCGFTKLFSMKGDCDSLTAIAVIAALAQSFTMLVSNANLLKAGIVHVYIPAAIGCLLFNTIGKLLIVSRTERNFRYISSPEPKSALFMVKDDNQAQVFTRGTMNDFPKLAAMKKTELITDFIKNSYNSDITDRFCRIFTPALIGAALIAGAVAVPVFKHAEYTDSPFSVAFSVFTGTICFCSCFAMMLVTNLPMARASKKFTPMQAAAVGYDAAEDFAETNSFITDASQLFPQGMVSLYRIKIFSDTRIDEAIVEAASLTAQAGSILKNMFYDIIAGKTELLNPVESYIYEDSMGLCGWINNRRVLLGNRGLMVNHSIEGLPSEEKEAEYTEGGRCAVYLSISGELSAMFILELKASAEVEAALKQLEKNHIYLMLRSVDSIVTINRLSEMFNVSPEMFKLIPFRLHPAYQEMTKYEPKVSATMACSDRFASASALILGAKKIHRSALAGICIQAVSMLLGVVLVILMVCMKQFSDLSVSSAILYNLAFVLITLLSQILNKV